MAMSEISDFETRITAALERIGRAVAAAEEQNGSGGGIASDEMMAKMGQLQEALDAERDTNAQLEERVRAIHEKQQTHVASLEEEVETLRHQLMVHDAETQKLRRVNAQLRANNTALRDANVNAIGDPALVNTALMTELEAIKVGRDSDLIELDAILNDLRPFTDAAQKEEA
jgi:septal ring factor EnvC (AmiA/AmiB activator)